MRFSPEQNFSRMHERDHPLIKAAHRKAESVISEHRIDPLTFVDLYGEESVKKDLRYVERCKEEFKASETPESVENKQLAEVFESILFQHIEQSDWFGPNTSTILASEFDDIHNGIDAILDIEEQNKGHTHIALGIDVTYAADPTRKLSKIKDGIDKGKLAKVRYFESEGEDFRGEMSNIPRIVLGVEARIVEALAALDLEGRNTLIARHPVQFELIEEVMIQCEGFAAYARKIGNIDIATKYERRLGFFKEIMKLKNASSVTDFGERGRVFKAIKDFMDSLS